MNAMNRRVRMRFSNRNATVPKKFRSILSGRPGGIAPRGETSQDRKSTRLNSSHSQISYAVFCLKKKKKQHHGSAKKQLQQSGTLKLLPYLLSRVDWCSSTAVKLLLRLSMLYPCCLLASSDYRAE